MARYDFGFCLLSSVLLCTVSCLLHLTLQQGEKMPQETVFYLRTDVKEFGIPRTTCAANGDGPATVALFISNDGHM